MLRWLLVLRSLLVHVGFAVGASVLPIFATEIVVHPVVTAGKSNWGSLASVLGQSDSSG